MSSATLNAARRTIKKPQGSEEGKVQYVLPGEETVIGYTTLETTDDSLLAPSEKVQAFPLEEPPTDAVCILRRAIEGRDLFWIVIAQGYGPVRYRWWKPQRNTASPPRAQDFICFGDNQEDTERSRLGTAGYIKNLQTIWKLMYLTGWPESAVKAAYSFTRRSYAATLDALHLATHTLNTTGGNTEEAHSELRRLLRLQGGGDHEELAQVLQGAKIEPNNTLPVLRGAANALHKPSR